MKKITSIICVIVIMSVILIPNQIYGDNSSGESLNFLVLGDSISTGYGLSGDTYTCGSYGNLEYEYLNKNGYNVTYTNKAVNGDTSSDLLKLLTENDEIISLVREADVIVYSIGGNDFLGSMIGSMAQAVGVQSNLGTVGRTLASNTYEDVQKMAESYLEDGAVFESYKARADKYAENGQKIYDRIRELNPHAGIYMQTLYNPMDNFEIFEPFKDFVDSTIKMFNNVTKSFDGEYKVLDVYDAFSGHGTEYTNIQAFDIHPNSEGHSVIFELLKDAVPLPPDETDADFKEETENVNPDVEVIDTEDEIEPLSTTPMIIISSIAVGVIVISFIIAGIQKIMKKR